MFVIIRTENAGAFAGELVAFDATTRTSELTDARRLWFWDGAASLSELATGGTRKPESCKFPAAVHVTLPQTIEIIEVTSAAQKSIQDVPVWSA
jgi:hypothetical protein